MFLSLHPVMIEYRFPKTNMFAPAHGMRGDEGLRPEVDWSQVRRARPLDRLLPGTERWAESLPVAFTPAHLIRIFPRVANRLAIAWQDAKAAQEVLNDVLIDRRGGRQGFPPLVQQELLRLGALIRGRTFPQVTFSRPLV